MPRKLTPTGQTPVFWRERLDVLSVEPPVVRWRARPLAMFNGVNAATREIAFKTWNKANAGQIVRAMANGRMRIPVTRPDGVKRLFDVRAIIAEIGLTPIGDLQWGVLHDGGQHPASGDLPRLGAIAETGRSPTDLSVLSSENDPYRMDTPSKRRAALWFVKQVDRFIDPSRTIHQRGVFYVCVSAGDVTLPDGETFENNATTAKFVSDASSYARWLGYIDFERLVDNKNDEPIVRPAPSTEPPTAEVCGSALETENLDADSLDVLTGLADFEPRQPYRLVFFGEKTSLDEVLGPLAIEFSADLYLTGGQISDTLMHRMASDAAEDGRPLVVLTFSDFDPAGYWDMPVVIGRKLQALKDLLFPELEFTVVHAALGPEQVRRLRLPDLPIKDGEGRGAIWKELYGSEQTEIDALATLNRDELERIARQAVKPYFDADLAERVRDAESAWQDRVDAEIAEQVDADRLDRLKARAAAALDQLRDVNAELEGMAAEIEVSEPPDLPEADMSALEEEQAKQRGAVLIDSDMDFVEATDRLRAHNEMSVRRETKSARPKRAATNQSVSMVWTSFVSKAHVAIEPGAIALPFEEGPQINGAGTPAGGGGGLRMASIARRVCRPALRYRKTGVRAVSGVTARVQSLGVR